MKIRLPASPRTVRGFSLPEVTIAVAVAGLGLVSLLGLLPQSLDSLRQAGKVNAETRIAQQVFADLSMSDRQDATGNDQIAATYDGRRYYFDDLAVQVEGDSAGLFVAYVAEVSVPESDVQLPHSGTGSTAPDPHLRRVMVKVANTGAPQFDFEEAAAGTFHTYASVISRTGK